MLKAGLPAERVHARDDVGHCGCRGRNPAEVEQGAHEAADTRLEASLHTVAEGEWRSRQVADYAASRIMRLPIILTALALPIAAAAQQSPFSGPSIPDFDVDRACAPYRQPQTIRICVEQEQDAYDQLKRIWPSTSVSARESAIKGAAKSLTSNAYYQVLRDYLTVALRREEAQRPPPPPPQFRR
jgi:hypothetical protein